MKKKKSKVFRKKASHKTRLFSLRFEDEAKYIRLLCNRISYIARKAPLEDRVKLRKVLDSLGRNADRLAGKA
jgi:hypothetical protein